MAVKRFEVYLINLDPTVGIVSCTFQGKRGQVVLDQIRTVDKARFVRRLGKVGKQTQAAVLSVLSEMFAP